MEAERRRALEMAQEAERDMRELERLVAKYKLVVVPSPSDPPPAIEKTSKKSYVRAAAEAEAIIRASGRPMQFADIFRTLTVDRGINLEGRAPANLLSSALSVRPSLYYVKDIGWWIRGVPWPPTAEDIAKLQETPLKQPDKYPKTWPSGPTKGGPRRSAEKTLLFETVRSLLRGRTESMKFAELFDRVKESGVTIGGQNERQNFAVFLGKFSCFMTEGRRGGWRYIPERDFEPGSASAGNAAIDAIERELEQGDE
jgi:hypothetical protein